ncbi:hypothetical protein LIER_14849 [Lithospermum erythrorhizon]|uniref:Uncharacterized protein n=1 Tax=Lithospermum erythrorhizon TaxID=34254 RepID=A0AAV3Q281_LITER
MYQRELYKKSLDGPLLLCVSAENISMVLFEGTDLVGKLPKAKGGLEYAVIAVDYFSKWVEEAPLKKTKEELGPNMGEQGNMAKRVANGIVVTQHHSLACDWKNPLVYGTEAVLPVERVQSRQFRVGNLVMRM